MFSEAWLAELTREWNSDSVLASRLGPRAFDAIVAFGVPEEDAPRFYLGIRAGVVEEAARGVPDSPDWDIRASEKQWRAWFAEPPGLLALGVAFTNRTLEIRRGNYTAMIKDPDMADAFVRSFAVMARAFRKVQRD